MLREHDSLFRQLLISADLILILLAFFIAYFLRSYLTLYFDDLRGLYPLSQYMNILPLVVVIWGITLSRSGAYQNLRRRSLLAIFFGIFKVNLLAAVIFGTVAYLLKLQFVSRLLLLSLTVTSLALLSLERLILIITLRYIRKRGYNTRYILLVGTGKRAQSFIRLIHNHPEWGLKIIGLIDLDPRLIGKKILGQKVIGKLTDIPHILDESIVDEVVFIVPRSWLGKIEEAILYCEEVGKRVSIAIDLFTLQFAKAKQSGLPGFPLLMFQSTSDKLLALFIKRLLDVVVSGLLIILLVPLFLVLALIVLFSSGRPVLFKQVRCGLNGRKFTLYKFRTMVVNAEKLLPKLQRHNEMTGPVFKMKDDPRLIRFGRFMRRFSLDELPQLMNVLRGDMSIVGPRPPIPAEVEKYKPWQRRRLSMRPGLTCLWQIRGRNRIVKFNEWMKLDLEYIDHWSLWLDLKIFFRTIPVVLFGIGAK